MMTESPELPTVTNAGLPALMASAQQLFDAEFYESALDIYRYVVAQYPLEWAAWYGLGRTHVAQDDHAVAAWLFELAAELGNRAAFLEMGARAWAQAGDNGRADQLLSLAWEAKR